MGKQKKYKRVEITFVDMISYGKAVWKLEELVLPKIKIVGYLWHKNKERVVLKRINGHPEDEPILIPAGCVIKIERLRTKNNRRLGK